MFVLDAAVFDDSQKQISIDAASDDFSIVRYAEGNRVARLGIDGKNLTETDNDCKNSDEKIFTHNFISFHKICAPEHKKHQQNKQNLLKNQAKKATRKAIARHVASCFFSLPFR